MLLVGSSCMHKEAQGKRFVALSGTNAVRHPLESTMSSVAWIQVADEVREGLDAGRPVVALESTLIAHGLPWPLNLETANAAELAVRECGVVPASIAVWKGKPIVGLAPSQIAELAREPGVLKASRRDLAM